MMILIPKIEKILAVSTALMEAVAWFNDQHFYSMVTDQELKTAARVLIFMLEEVEQGRPREVICQATRELITRELEGHA